MTLWEGRISTGMADAVAAFTVSLPFDKVLAPDDLAGSRAHVKGLGKAGILSDSEVTTLARRRSTWSRRSSPTGVFVFAPGDEDIHTAVERRVTELAGDVGAKLHTGRSRNDQVATDLRLWCRRSLVGVAERDHGAPGRAGPAGPRGRRRLPARATPTCSGRSRCCWPITCWPTAGPWPATWTAS